MPAEEKEARRARLMARQRDIVEARQAARSGGQALVMVDGPSPEHEWVYRGRLAGQAPDIDPVVYLTEADPSLLTPGRLIDVEIVGARGYDLIARPL